MTTHLTPSEREAYELIERHKIDNPDMPIIKIAHLLGLNENSYYQAKRKMLDVSPQGFDAIRPNVGVMKKKVRKMVWCPVNLRGEWVVEA